MSRMIVCERKETYQHCHRQTESRQSSPYNPSPLAQSHSQLLSLRLTSTRRIAMMVRMIEGSNIGWTERERRQLGESSIEHYDLLSNA